MRDKYIKQLFERYKRELHKETVSNITELYEQFIVECKGFRKKLMKLSEKKEAPQLSEAIDNLIQAYTDCFFELAYAYFDKGFCNGFCSAAAHLKPI